MKRLYCFCVLFNSSICFSQQPTNWNYKKRLFVEKVDSAYVLFWFHHKVEMNTDTLWHLNDSEFNGEAHTLYLKRNSMFLALKNTKVKLKLIKSTKDDIESMQRRKDFYLINK